MLADIVELSKRVFKEKPNDQISTSAYLLNMAIRLKPMRRVLKDTGSIYLHCDPTASHYLKMIMDAIFGQTNFRNENVWCYRKMPNKIKSFQKNHDILFFYSKSNNYQFNVLRGEMTEGSKRTFESAANRGYNANNSKKMVTVFDWDKYTDAVAKGIIPDDLKPTEFKDGKPPLKDWWEDIKILGGPYNKERLGYPTQKPIALLKRIIEASSNIGDVVFDPFCGCGTTLHAAEELGRQWIGIDISQFSAGLVRNRLIDNFKHKQLHRGNIPVIGCPLTLQDAQNLARTSPFEFEKWACGEVGAQGLFHAPGERGSDGGVDGIIPFYHSKDLFDSNEPPEKTFAVVQVKGGKVNPDSVKALSTTVRQSNAKCGVLICFEKYMRTVENNREKNLIRDMQGEFNFIQGLSVENLIEGNQPRLPGINMAA
ncbi:MAG: DNA methyltransferase [Acidiferrobacterales bacterium]|nr:DNA methyltransferase [Acidiferrobacterales bacterium]